MQMIKNRLQIKYTLSILFVILAVVTILAGTLIFQFRRSIDLMTHSSVENLREELTDQLRNRGITLVNVIEKELVNPFYDYDMNTIYSILNRSLAQEDVVYIYLFDQDGKVVHDGLKQIPNLNRTLDDHYSLNLIKNRQLSVLDDEKVMDVSMPIFLGTDYLGGVRVGLTKENLFSNLNSRQERMGDLGKTHVKYTIWAIVVLIFLFSIFGVWLAYLVSRNLSRPIVNLARLTAQVGRGEYEIEAPEINRNDEIGDLGRSFVKMADDLKRTTVSKKYVDDIINQMVDLLVVVSLEGTIVRVNQAASTILGYTEEELLGRPLAMVLEEELFKQRWKDLVIKKGVISGVETKLVTKDQRIITIQFSGALMKNSRGETQGIVCVAQDVSQLKKNQKFAAIGQLAASVAHELRNPLGAIKNSIYYLKEVLKDSSVSQEDPTIIEFMDLCEKEIKRSNRIVSELLDYSREVRLRIQLTALEQLLEDVKGALEVPTNISWSKSAMGEIPKVWVDPQKIQQVFINLGTNAIQAMPDGGKLDIKMWVEDDNDNHHKWVKIDFTDSGVGMSQENLKHIFEPLFTTRTKGTGLGLAISLEIIKAHRGVIGVISEEGKGTTFTVALPMAA